jgi:RNA polymerase sigma-70 factor (ECF subfamily)
MINDDDAGLVKKCLQGDVKSFEVLVDKYQKPIFNVALRMCNDYDSAEDISQAAFVKAYNNLNSFNPKYKFFSWICRIVINEGLNFLKQKKKLLELDENIISTEITPDQVFEQMELSHKIRNALMEIEPNYRILIELRHFQNCSYSEMGDILNIPEKKVKSRLYTARQVLGKVLIKIGIEKND